MSECISRSLIRIAFLALALCAAGARADAPEYNPMFSFSGFGTLGVVHSSERQAEFTSSIFKPNGAGYSHAWSADVDSLIGGQVTANFTPKLSAVLQVIAEQNYDNTYRPHVEWANIKFQLTPDFSVRAGRTLLPTFLLSDSRKVAYTYPWVRPPLEVYRLGPITTNDGVDATYRIRLGDVANTLQAHYGENESRLPGGGAVKTNQLWGLAYTGDYRAVTVHIGYESTHVTLDGFKPIFDAFRQFGPEGIAVSDKYDVDDRPLSVITLGARYDPGQWFVMGEWSHLHTQRSFFGSGTGWYVSGGYRLGKFTPYLTYSQAKADNLSDPGLNLSTLPPPLTGPAAGLNGVLNSLLRTKPVQNTVSIGARWDFAKNAALKLQYDHTRIGTGSTGVLNNPQPGFQAGGRVNVFSATIDFVF